MKTIIVIETAKELFEFACDVRSEGDTMPFLGNKAKLIFENNMENVSLEGVDGFELSDSLRPMDIITAAINKMNIAVHIT